MPRLKHDGFGYYITRKGYPRFHVKGPMRGMYVHRYEAEKMLGRKLRRDEQVHHRDFNKLNWQHGNLRILGEAEHGWVTAKQTFWMNLLDIKPEKYFHEVFEEIESEGVRTGLREDQTEARGNAETR